MTPSSYQLSIYDHVRRNEAQRAQRRSLVVSAKAGSGKSTTCLEAMLLMEQLGARPSYSTYNANPLREFKDRAKSRGLRCAKTSIKTVHGFGYSALRNHLNLPWSHKPEARKVSSLLWRRFGSHSEAKELIPLADKLIVLAKDFGLGLPGQPSIDDQSAWEALALRFNITHKKQSEIYLLSHVGLSLSNSEPSVIDFPDMLYLALLLGAQPEQYDYVVVDEAQDTNATRREFFMKMRKPWGCLFIVGDESQAIYGFTGADNESMRLLSEPVHADKYDLPVCYRCDKAIIKHAQRYCPGIEWREGAGEGEVSSVKYKDLVAALGDDSSDMDHPLDGSCAILCRTNAPNARLAFTLLRHGIPCRIEGKDIGFALVKLVDYLHADSLTSFITALNAWQEIELEKARSKNQESAAELIHDKHQILCIMVDRARETSSRGAQEPGDLHSIQWIKDQIRAMFTDASDPSTPRNILVLSSVHKSKGREWDTVYILGRDSLMPFPRATSPSALQQENNLIYVAITRAKNKLINITNIPE